MPSRPGWWRRLARDAAAVLVFAAVVAAFFALAMLGGCAYIAGPCSLSLGELREAICEAGGVMLLMPPPKEPLLQQVAPAIGGDPRSAALP